MKKFDVLLKISFYDRYMVEANTEQEAKEQVKQMFLEQANVPNTPVLDWTTESFAVAKQDGQLDCYAEEAEEV